MKERPRDNYVPEIAELYHNIIRAGRQVRGMMPDQFRWSMSLSLVVLNL